jgi:hypothetical protein
VLDLPDVDPPAVLTPAADTTLRALTAAGAARQVSVHPACARTPLASALRWRPGPWRFSRPRRYPAGELGLRGRGPGKTGRVEGALGLLEGGGAVA